MLCAECLKRRLPAGCGPEWPAPHHHVGPDGTRCVACPVPEPPAEVKVEERHTKLAKDLSAALHERIVEIMEDGGDRVWGEIAAFAFAHHEQEVRAEGAGAVRDCGAGKGTQP